MLTEHGLDIPRLDLSADYHIYVLRVQRHDGQRFFYVGMSEAVLSRLKSHARYGGQNMRVPTTNGAISKDTDFEIQEVVEVEGLHDTTAAEARERERRKAYELAIDHNTTNVIGGR
jgi:hypothetical protein